MSYLSKYLRYWQQFNSRNSSLNNEPTQLSTYLSLKKLWENLVPLLEGLMIAK